MILTIWGPGGPLRQLADYKGEALVSGVLALIRHFKPMHVSFVGGEPLVRCRELEILLPKLADMGVDVQLVTSAVRSIPTEWRSLQNLHLVVSVDGLQPEHDKRCSPATGTARELTETEDRIVNEFRFGAAQQFGRRGGGTA